MMDNDILMSSSVNTETMSAKYQPQVDTRFHRDMQKDLHEGLDMMFNFAKALRDLHPDARRHIETIMEKGEWL